MAQGNKKLLWQKIVCKRHKSFFDKAQTDLKRNKELYDVGGISKQT